MRPSRKTTTWIVLGVIVAGVVIAFSYRPIQKLQRRWAVESILESDATNQQKLDKLAEYVAIGDNIDDVNARLGTDYGRGFVVLDESTGLALAIDDDGTVVGIVHGLAGTSSKDWNWLHSPQGNWGDHNR